MSYEISVIEREPGFAAVVTERHTVEEIAEMFPRVFEAIMKVVPMSDVVGPPLALYDMTDDHAFNVSAGFPVREPIKPVGEVHSIELPGGQAVQTTHVGPYQAVGAAYQAIEAWFGANGWRPAGPPWETYLDEAGVENPRTIVTWPVAKA